MMNLFLFSLNLNLIVPEDGGRYYLNGKTTFVVLLTHSVYDVNICLWRVVRPFLILRLSSFYWFGTLWDRKTDFYDISTFLLLLLRFVFYRKCDSILLSLAKPLGLLWFQRFSRRFLLSSVSIIILRYFDVPQSFSEICLFDMYKSHSKVTPVRFLLMILRHSLR